MKKMVSLWILGMLGFTNIHAQHSIGSLEEVWSYGLENQEQIHIGDLQVQRAIDEKKTANSYFLPTITGTLGGQHNIDITETPVPGALVGQSEGTVYMKFGKAWTYNAGIAINYSLLDWQKIYQSRNAGLNVDLAQANKLYYEQTLKEQLAQLYYACLTAAETMEISQLDMVLADSILSLTEDRFREGYIDALTMNQAKINQNGVAQKLESSRQYYHQCLANLKILMGLEVSDSLIMREKLQVTETSGIPEIAFNSRYMDPFLLQLELSEMELKKSRAAFTPKVGMNAYFGYTQFQDGFSMAFESAEWRPNNYIGISLSIPIFTGFLNRSQVASSKVTRSISELDYSSKLRETAITDSLLLQNYYSSLNIARSALVTHRLAGANLKLAKQKYEQGLFGLDNYLSVFEDYLATEDQYFSRLSDFLINKSRIEARKPN